MKNLIVAFLMANIAILILCIALVLIGVEKTAAISISTVILSGIPFIHQTLEKNECKKAKAPILKFVPLNKFTYSFRLALIYAFLVSFSVLNFSGFLGGLITGTLRAQIELLAQVEGILALFITMPMFFFVGRWIGVKSSSNGITVVILAIFLSRIATSILGFTILPSGEFENIYGQNPSISLLISQTLGGGIMFSVIALLGYWQGRKHQLPAYLGYLMSQVQEEARNVIIELAFEEAVKSENRNI